MKDQFYLFWLIVFVFFLNKQKRIEGGEVCDLTNNVCCNLKNIKVKSDDIKDDEDEKTECGTRYQHNVDTRIDATGEEDNEIEAEYGKKNLNLN